MYTLLTFGGIVVELDGRRLDQPRIHRKALALLTVLSVDDAISRERLMALFWPDSDNERAKGSLNQAMHLLRQQLQLPDLFSGSTEVRLNPDRIISDVNLFRQALAEENYEKAGQIYSGPFLNGFYLEGVPGFEQWAEDTRQQLDNKYMKALEKLALSAESNDDFIIAAEWWQKLQDTDPYNSRVAIQLMLALGYSGDRAAALRHARRHQDLLKNELGMKPDPAIAELEGQLRMSGSLPAQHFDPISKTISKFSKSSYIKKSLSPETLSVNSETTSQKGKPLTISLRRTPLYTLVIGFIAVLAAIVIWIRTPDTGSPEIMGYQDDFTIFPEKGSIAVLPFINLSAEPDQEYFSDGITDEIISSLSRVRGLKVSGRTSSFQFKDQNPNIQDIRRRLAVESVLEGSIRKSGDRLRINVQLINTKNGFQLWSGIYERHSVDIFKVQEEISRAIIQAIQGQISDDDISAASLYTEVQNLEVYELYLKGLYFFNQLQIPLAIRYFEEAIQRDARYARAHAALAETYAVPAAYSELSPVDLRGRGVEAAHTALHIDPDLAEAHSALGWLEMIGLEWQAAEKSLKRGVELDPYAPRGRFYYALYLHRQGKMEESLQELNIARKLDPLSLPINSIYGMLLGELGHINEAIHQLEETLELAAHPVAHAILGHIYMGQGHINQAIHQYETVYEMVPTSFYAGFLGHAYARAGRVTDARELLSELTSRSDQGEYISPGAIGWIYLGLEKPNEGYFWLEKAVIQRDVFLTIYGMMSNSFLTAPYMDDLRFLNVRSGTGLASALSHLPLHTE